VPSALRPALASGAYGAASGLPHHDTGRRARRWGDSTHGENAATRPQFPYGMRNATATYASSASTDVAAYEDLLGHHLLAVRNLIATTNDKSYHGSTIELLPATSHGYAEWDFPSVLDLVMFQRFLEAADYWFDYSDDSSIESYDPTRECFVVVADE
jgi:hypothetical protein